MAMSDGWKVFIEHTPWNGDSHKLHMIHSFQGKRSAVTNFTLDEITSGQITPCAEIFPVEDKQDGVTSLLQAMIDAAWEAGFRPRGHEDHNSELTATRYHLEDMRTLALRGSDG